jgi:hypothetical protein
MLFKIYGIDESIPRFWKCNQHSGCAGECPLPTGGGKRVIAENSGTMIHLENDRLFMQRGREKV